MTLPASGAISFNAINVELGQPGATSANINQASYRTLAGVPSGTIALSNFYGKSNAFSFTFTGGTNVNLRNAAISAGWNQSSAVVATISGNVGIMTINGAFPNGVAMTINPGVYVVGAGGSGGFGTTAIIPGGAGGVALSVSVPVSITNNGVVGGGGGGGGSGAGNASKPPTTTSGGGGGAGFPVGTGGGTTGGGANQFGRDGTLTTGGLGGFFNAPGGAGGGPGSNGGTGGNVYSGGGGGGLGGAGGTGGGGGAPGGAAGAATSGNSYITWVATGTRYGALN